MIVTATEFKTNLSKYLDMVTNENIYITIYGKIVAKLTDPRISAVDSLRGMLKYISEDIDLDSLRDERLFKHEDRM